ncbi:hypothetical protein ACQ4PT_028880 [Festuca glaucescens]
MGEVSATTATELKEVRSAVDLLHGRMAVIDTTQQSLVAQLAIIAEAVKDGSLAQAENTRHFAAMERRLEETIATLARPHVPSPSREEDDADPVDVVVTGHSKVSSTHVSWMGDSVGAGTSSVARAGDSPHGDGDGLLGGNNHGAGSGGFGGAGGGRQGGVGAGGLGGAGGGGVGGSGGGRHGTGNDPSTKHNLKMSFPRFDGNQPRIWKDKCLDYFRLFSVHPSLWLVSTTLHMEGNAALWLKAYRLRHEITTWPALMTAVEEKFGADDHRKYMKQFLALKQKGTVEEYQAQFEQLSYQISMQNPHYDEQFFVSQFIKGLKSDIRSMVEAQVPDTVERAMLLATVQQEVLAAAKPWGQRAVHQGRVEAVAPRVEGAKQAIKLGTGELWKDRQLRDYRRANNLCFRCGDKYDPTHQCHKKPAAELHVTELEQQAEILSEEVLNLMELHDLEEATQLSLSIHAMAGTEGSETLRLRAMVGNQVLLILVDSGSSNSFINASMAERLQCSRQTIESVPVKIANGQYMHCTEMVPDLTWWCQGETFSTSLRVLELGAYDAILGIDWLKQHSPMVTDWENHCLAFPYNNKFVKLKGIAAPTLDKVEEIPIEQLLKWYKGNEVWAMAIVKEDKEDELKSIHPEIQAVLEQFIDVFATPSTLPPERPYDHAIPLKPEATPFNSRPYRYSPAHKDEIERQVQSMLDSGVIVPSMSPYASPVLLIQKKDGSWRFCIDYRRLNELTVKNTFPMPVIDELLDELGGARVFSKLDLRAGYHQIRMLPGDEPKTAFKTHQGHYQFRVMPFGLCNAPATFQCVMNLVLSPCLRRSVLVFMDDILVYSASVQEHVQHLTEVLALLREHQLYVKESKCSFACSSLEYLGHIISENGVSTDPKKTEAMSNWPQPTTITELRGFLGLTGYYRKFVRNYAIIAKPLTNLLKKKSFMWTDIATAAFQSLKQAMLTTPVLQLPDFSKQFVVETDACDLGIGAVLMQDQHPLAFLSKPLSQSHQHLSIYEKEFLALIMAVERWRPYLQRSEFLIKTDHHSLCYLDDQNLQSPLQRKAMARLMGLQFKIIYRKGAENHAADSLSRVGLLMTIQTCATVQPAWLQEVINTYATDQDAQRRLTELALHSPDEHGYSLKDGLIRYQDRVWLGRNSALQTKLISAFHASAIGGHSGAQATYQRLKRLFAWTGMKGAVTDFVSQCDVCQHAKHINVHPHGLLQPLPVPAGAWQDITIDFIEGLPLSDGANTILVAVDRLTKYAHFMPMKHPFSAQQVARTLIDTVVKLHGMPRSIVSDRDRIFTSTFWKLLFEKLGTKLKFTTAYHPQTDGQSERVNQGLEMYLRCSIHANPTHWKKWLPVAELWYNSSFHSTIGVSPFQALYGYEPNFGAIPDIGICSDNPVAAILAERAVQLENLKVNMAAAQNRMKQKTDKNRTEKEFQMGDTVLLKLQPYVQKSVVSRPYPKLAYKYFGPYKILERIGKVAYRLELPKGSLVHPVFHVSQLKDYKADYTPVFSELPDFPTLDRLEVVPERALHRRMVKKGNSAITQEDLLCPRTMLQEAVWTSLYKCVEPVLTSWPINKLRNRALNNLMEHIHYEDDNTQYLCICAVNKALNMICCWEEDPNSDAFKRHLVRVPDFLWFSEDGMKAQVYVNIEGDRAHAVNTAWAMLALIYAGQMEQDSAPLHRAAKELINMQMDTGEFPQEHVGCFNCSLFFNYPNYRNLFPIWALGEYRRRLRAKNINGCASSS